jgi:hypothetical protein
MSRIKIAMQLKATSFTMVRITFPFALPDISTFGAFLRRKSWINIDKSWINIDNSLTKSFGFIFQKPSKLKETPVIEFSVKLLSFSGLDSNTLCS